MNTAINDLTKRVYLLGSYFINSNYGDIIQARPWITFYKNRGYRINYIVSGLEHKDEFTGNLGDVELVRYDTVMEKDNFESGDMVFHFYGGGYLNRLWGKEFLNLMIKATEHDKKIIITGVQLDEVWLKSYLEKVKNKRQINWISVRDPKSREILGKPGCLIGDDSFIYFKEKLKLGERPLPFKTGEKKIIAHFNCSSSATIDIFSSLYLRIAKNSGRFAILLTRLILNHNS